MRRQWRIDVLEEGSAAVEQDGRIIQVPRWLLPAGARENDVVLIEVSGDAERVVRLTVDAEATRAALEASRRQVASTPPQNDPGGPIQL